MTVSTKQKKFGKHLYTLYDDGLSQTDAFNKKRKLHTSGFFVREEQKTDNKKDIVCTLWVRQKDKKTLERDLKQMADRKRQYN